MAWKDHKKWQEGKKQEQAAGEPITRPAKPATAQELNRAASQDKPATTVPQANFVAQIAVSPSIQKSRNLTADILQVALDEALQKLVQFEKTITVHVAQEK
jgi:hypothetical protein